MNTHYILDDQHNVKPTTVREWARWMNHADRKVDQTTIDDIYISTVFMGLDHRIFEEEGPPIVFETMIFGGKFDQWQDRCATWSDAVKMHERAIALVKEGK